MSLVNASFEARPSMSGAAWTGTVPAPLMVAPSAPRLAEDEEAVKILALELPRIKVATEGQTIRRAI